MRCEEIREKTDAYLEQELNEKESIEFENHLKSCRNCRMEMESVKKCIDMMKNIFSDKLPPSEMKKMVFEKTCCPPDNDC